MTEPIDQGRHGLSRRQMIKASAVAGAAAWTAPVIIDSLASPAAAGSVALPCSWFYVVFKVGTTLYFTGAQSGSQACNNLANASHGWFCSTCNGVTYSLNDKTVLAGSGCGVGTPIANISTTLNCADYIDFSGTTVSVVAGSGATIITAFSHPGGGTICSPCGTFSQITVCSGTACEVNEI